MDERKAKKMLGVTLLSLVAALTPDDVNALKAGGCADEAKVLLEALDRAGVCEMAGDGAGRQEELGCCPDEA